VFVAVQMMQMSVLVGAITGVESAVTEPKSVFPE
jgi:hypothetical protein